MELSDREVLVKAIAVMQEQIKAIDAKEADKPAPLFIDSGINPKRYPAWKSYMRFLSAMWACKGAEPAIKKSSEKTQYTISPDGIVVRAENIHFMNPLNAFFPNCELTQAAIKELGGTELIRKIHVRLAGLDA